MVRTPSPTYPISPRQIRLPSLQSRPQRSYSAPYSKMAAAPNSPPAASSNTGTTAKVRYKPESDAPESATKNSAADHAKNLCSGTHDFDETSAASTTHDAPPVLHGTIVCSGPKSPTSPSETIKKEEAADARGLLDDMTNRGMFAIVVVLMVALVINHFLS